MQSKKSATLAEIAELTFPRSTFADREVSFRKFMSSSFAAFVVRAAAAGFSFSMNVVVVRLLGAHEAGIFFLGQTFLLILAMLPRIGLDNVLVRFVSVTNDQGKPGAANGVLLKAVMLALPLAVFSAGITYAKSDWICSTVLNQPEFVDVLRLFAIAIIPFAGFQLFSFALQGNRCFVWAALINSVLFPMSLLIAASFSGTFGVDSAAALAKVAITSAVAILALSVIVWSRTTDQSIQRNSVQWRVILAAALPTFVIAICSYANTWSPQLVLAAFVEPDQVAVFSVSQRTAALLTLFLLPVSAVAAPTFAELHARNELDELRAFVRRVNGLTLLISFPPLMALFAFAPQILSIFGPQFAEAKWVLRILVSGQLCNVITGGNGFLLIMSGNERSFRNSSIISTVGGLVLAFLLIPRFGVIGAAIAAAVSLLIWNSSIWLHVYMNLGINVMNPDPGFSMRLVCRVPGMLIRCKPKTYALSAVWNRIEVNRNREK